MNTQTLWVIPYKVIPTSKNILEKINTLFSLNRFIHFVTATVNELQANHFRLTRDRKPVHLKLSISSLPLRAKFDFERLHSFKQQSTSPVA